jgi:hypothetical protein
MDTQFNILANDPALRDTYGVMEYLTGYVDEEVNRWTGRLYRHYLLEGNRTLLSKDPYLSPHIANPDFDEGESNWTLKPAEAGSMAVRHAREYGYLQGRYSLRLGDTFLWARRSAERPNAFSQEIVNLEPGRTYSVKMYTADYHDYLEGKAAAVGKHAVTITIDGGEMIEAKCTQRGFKSIHRRYDTNAPTHKPWFNYFRYVFRAKGETARLAVSDWLSPDEPGGPVGQELMYNFIEVQPYLE